MATVQLSFSLRTSSSIKTVNLLGSWDNYSVQLPLSRDRVLKKPGCWKGTYRFPGTILQQGKRYWYYYIIDGYHVSHDPGHPSTIEPTTNRALNILDIPREKPSHRSPSKSASSNHSSSDIGRRSNHYMPIEKPLPPSPRRASGREGHNLTVEIPKGRPLSFSQIKSPKPITPHATKFILEADYSTLGTEQLTSGFNAMTIGKQGGSRYNSPSSSISSGISNWSERSSPSSASSLSDYGSSCSSSSNCSCERYGITMGGNRIKLDCGGSRCGYIDDSDSCCSLEGDNYTRSTRRNGIFIGTS